MAILLCEFIVFLYSMLTAIEIGRALRRSQGRNFLNNIFLQIITTLIVPFLIFFVSMTFFISQVSPQYLRDGHFYLNMAGALFLLALMWLVGVLIGFVSRWRSE